MVNIQDDFEIINNYVNSLHELINDYRSCMIIIDKLHMFIEKHKYIVKVDTIIELLEKNKNYKKCIETIFNKNRKQITDGKVNIIFKNELLISSIDVYCMLNKIEVKEFIEDFEYNQKDFDGLAIYFEDIKDNRLLSYEEEQELTRKVKQGDREAKVLFIESNLKLVVSVAKLYRNKGLPMQDLIQEGNLALLTALDKFDPNRGYRFSTYAYSWIKQFMARAIANNSRTIRYPVYLIERYNKLLSIKISLTNKLKREPTVEELSKAVNMPVNKVRELLNIQVQPTSLDILIGEDKDAELSSFIPDPDTNVEEDVLNITLKEDVNKLLHSGVLNEREIEVLKYRFGFDGCDRLTLSDIGSMFGITRERVRQIEARALSKLRRSHCILKFETYKFKPDARRENISMISEHSLNTGITNKNNLKEYKTIYETFSNYSKTEINLMLHYLNKEERNLITKMFGNELEYPYVPILDYKEMKKYQIDVLPKINRVLKANRNRQIGSVTRNEEMSKLLTKGLKEKEEKKQMEIEEVSTILLQKYEFDKETENLLNRLKSVLKKEDYNRLYEVIVSAKQNDFLKEVSTLELIILLLSLGYIKSKYYSINEISNFLIITEDRVKEIANKSLQQYENDIVNALDELLATANKKLLLSKKRS